MYFANRTAMKYSKNDKTNTLYTYIIYFRWFPVVSWTRRISDYLNHLKRFLLLTKYNKKKYWKNLIDIYTVAYIYTSSIMRYIFYKRVKYAEASLGHVVVIFATSNRRIFLLYLQNMRGSLVAENKKKGDGLSKTSRSVLLFLLLSYFFFSTYWLYSHSKNYIPVVLQNLLRSLTATGPTRIFIYCSELWMNPNNFFFFFVIIFLLFFFHFKFFTHSIILFPFVFL